MNGDIWVPYFDVEQVVVLGKEWPLLLVTKWVENSIGERRFVESRMVEVPPRDAPQRE